MYVFYRKVCHIAEILPMPQNHVKRIHLIYGCISAAIIVAVGIALIISCLNIYNSGPHPYSVESITAQFTNIALLVYFCIALILGGFVLHLALPCESARPKAIRDTLAALNKLKAKGNTPNPQDVKCIDKEHRFRKNLRIATALCFVALLVYPAIYFSNASHFSIANLSDDIIKAVLIVMIPAAVGLLLCFVCTIFEEKSLQRELEIYKNGTKAESTPAETAVKPKNWLPVVRCVVLVLAVCFIVLGITNGGMKDVLDKAVAICTECIGLG